MPGRQVMSSKREASAFAALKSSCFRGFAPALHDLSRPVF